MSFIYKITNKTNGKVYIGKTIHSIEERWKDHIRCMKKGYHWHLSNAIRCDGEGNFQIECLEILPSEKLSEREIFWIAYFNSTDNTKGYNQTFGGEGLTATEEIKGKISASCMGRISPMLGRSHSEESIRKMRESHTGKVVAEETKLHLSIINKGKIISEEQKRKTSLANTGRKLSIEQRQKISNAHSGKSLSEEHRLHISEGLRKRFLQLQGVS